MPILPGTRLGPYEVLALIGQGGMGEVYRATDINLKRAVALKVLPEAVAADRDRVARFQREAELLAALNHPNIAQIHGLERSNGITALVMELVEGPTLADRIARGPIQIDDISTIARQIAEALEAAHERGIVHRDLKPANVKIREDGMVKVLDFGLAKALSPDGGSATANEASQSPTITSPAMTHAGMILGTALYMAPEQARGRSVDRRADIWAFGCVLYEMLTRKRAFDGEDVTEIIGAVIHKTPDLNALPPDTPDSLRTMLRLCLVKDPKRRLRDAGDLRLMLDGSFDGGRTGEPPTSPSRQRVGLVAAIAVAGLALAAGIWVFWTPGGDQSPLAPATFELPNRSGEPLGGVGADIVVTPDGRRVVYLAGLPGKKQIVVRALDRLDPVVIGPAGQVHGLFVSPDGEWIGYVDATTRSLMKINVAGGQPVMLCRDLPAVPSAGAWSSNDLIVFAISSAAGGSSAGLWSVAAAGGTPQKILTPDAARAETYGRPEFLPGGQTLLFDTGTIDAPIDAVQIEALDLRSGARKVVLRGGSHPRYTASGHLLYATPGSVRAVRFDAAALEVIGSPVEALDGVITKQSRTASFTVSATGTAAYIKGRPVAARRSIVWVDRAGREESVGVPARAYAYAFLSPDNTSIALDSRDEDLDIWIWHVARRTMTRLTIDPGISRSPVWEPPSGRRLAFTSTRDGVEQAVWQAADGSSPEAPITSDPVALVPKAFSPDGRWLLLGPGVQPFDLHIMDLQAPSPRPRPLLVTPFNEMNGEVSPDGKWLAYQSNESGRYEAYIRPFPDVTSARFQVSTGGATRPVWAHDGRQLFYSLQQSNLVDNPNLNSDSIVSVSVRPGPSPSFGPPTVVVKGGYVAPFAGRHYDVARDGRFLMIKDARGPDEVNVPPHIVVVQNWLDELKRLVPAN